MQDNIEELSQAADQMRLRIIDMVVRAKGGHLGGHFRSWRFWLPSTLEAYCVMTRKGRSGKSVIGSS